MTSLLGMSWRLTLPTSSKPSSSPRADSFSAFGSGTRFTPRDEIAEQIIELGALLEWSSTNLLAVDTVDEALAQTVADALHEHEQLGHLVYETGKSA